MGRGPESTGNPIQENKSESGCVVFESFALTLLFFDTLKEVGSAHAGLFIRRHGVIGQHAALSRRRVRVRSPMALPKKHSIPQSGWREILVVLAKPSIAEILPPLGRQNDGIPRKSYRPSGGICFSDRFRLNRRGCPKPLEVTF